MGSPICQRWGAFDATLAQPALMSSEPKRTPTIALSVRVIASQHDVVFSGAFILSAFGQSLKRGWTASIEQTF
jgi:hypothetical protein